MKEPNGLLSNGRLMALSGLGRASASTLQVYQTLLEQPIVTAGRLTKKTGITPATVNKSLGHLQTLGIIKELTAQKRNRIFSYWKYIEIMNQGIEEPEG